MSNSFDAVIAGGGIAGFAAALALDLVGLRVCILEREPTVQETGAGIQLGPNAVKVMRALGLETELMRHAGTIEHINLRDGKSGNQLLRVPVAKACRRRHGAPYAVIHRADLLNLLHTRAAEATGIDIRNSAAVEGFRETGQSVSVTYTGGTATGSLLIGADGLWSGIREQILGDGPPRDSGRMAWRTVVPASHLPGSLSSGDTTVWMMPDAHVVHYPVRQAREINIVAITRGSTETLGWSQPGDRQALMGAFRGSADILTEILGGVDGWRTWPLFDREPAAHYCSGRVALIGDAAHPALPYLAQGGAMAIEDGFTLARCLRDRRGQLEAALANYNRLRLKRTIQVQVASRRQLRAYHAHGPLGALRNAALRYAHKAAPDLPFKAFDWLYGFDATAGFQGASPRSHGD